MTAEELLARLKAGKIYRSDKVEWALSHFFNADNILQLRELALKEVALRVAKKVEDEVVVGNVGVRHEKILVCISTNEKTPRKLIRKAARLAIHHNTQFSVLYVQTPKESADRIPLAVQRHLLNHFKLATELGGEVIQLQKSNVIDGIIEACANNHITKCCIGKPELSFFSAVFSIMNYKKLVDFLSSSNIDLIILA